MLNGMTHSRSIAPQHVVEQVDQVAQDLITGGQPLLPQHVGGKGRRAAVPVKAVGLLWAAVELLPVQHITSLILQTVEPC